MLYRYVRRQRRIEILIIRVGLRRVIATAYDLCNARDADPLYIVRKAVFYMVGSVPRYGFLLLFIFLPREENCNFPLRSSPFITAQKGNPSSQFQQTKKLPSFGFISLLPLLSAWSSYKLPAKLVPTVLITK